MNPKKLIQKLTARLAVLAILAFSAANALAAGTNVVIVEAYGGGGNSGSVYKNDFIGLFNRGTTPVSLAGWSVQYNSAASTTAAWQSTPLTGSIPAGGYFLIQEAAGTGGTTALPTPDVTGTIPMGGTGFKVALVASTTLLTGQNASGTGPTIIDFVGASPTANGFEGTGPAPAPSNTASVQRNSSGCADTDNNAADFIAAAPIPRNSSAATHSCAIVTAPLISGVTPANLTTNAGYGVTFTVTLSQGDAPLFYQWYKQSSDTTVNTPIAGATNASLVLPSVLGTDSTNYVVVVTNNATANNSVTSSVVTLTVIDPGISVQPVSQLVLTNGTAQFTATAAGTGISYQWYFDADPSDISQITGPVSDGSLPSGAIVAGSASSSLTISNVNVATQTNFVLVVTGTFGSVTSSVASLTVGSVGVPLAFWNFNGIFNPTNPAPNQGIGTAMGVSVVTFVQPTVDGDDLTPPAPNTAWGTQTYPATATVSNKQTGVQFNVSTLGAKDIKVSFDVRGTTTASKYQRLQYTTNGTDFIDYPTSQTVVGSTYNSFAYDLTGFPGVANNTNFGIRVVAEFENTAKYNNTNDATYVGVSAGYSSSGTLSYDIVNITGDAITNNNIAPVVSAIANQTMEDTIGTTASFTVSDDTTAAGSLVVNAVSLDPATSVSFTPVNTGGNVQLGINSSLGNVLPIIVPVLVTVTDKNGDSTTASFTLTINPANGAPAFTGLVDTNMLINTTLVIPFTVSDDHTPASSLSPTATSGNTSVVPNDGTHLVIGGSGTNRTLTITLAADQSGAVPITVSAADGSSLVGSQSFVLEVRPNTDVVLIDGFDYDTAGKLTAVSAGLWKDHSGTANQMAVSSGTVMITGTNSEDVNALLINGPYTTNSSAVLYSSYVINYSVLPDDTGAYFGHFKDNTTFGFLGRVWASTTNAAAGKFRLGIANSTSTSSSAVQVPQDLSLGVNYQVVTRLVVATGISTLWINPTSESSTSVTDPTDITTNKVNIYSYALREANGSEGTLFMDNLKVGTSFTGVTGLPSTVTPPPAPIIGGITIGGPGGTNIIITGTNNNGTTSGSYVLLASTNIALPLGNWTVISTQAFNADGTLSVTNPIGADTQRFYILQALP